jgi:uncharacterized RDD family membrane protein YckC
MADANDNGGTGENSGAAAAPRHPIDESYYVRGDAEAHGPYEGRIVKEMIEQSRILPTTGIAPVGATEWTEVKDHPFFSTLWAVGSGPGAVPFPGAPGSSPEHARQPVRYGGFWIRLAAFMIDFIFAWIIIAVAAFFVGFVIGIVLSRSAESTVQNAANVAGALTALVVGVLYYVPFVSGGWQGTAGKRLLGLHVVTTTGERVSGSRALGRLLAYILSGIILCIGFMMIGWNKEKKALHDIICGTRVVYGEL